MDVSIVIVSWNVRGLLKKCLESIFKFSRNIDFEIIVVDNASEDGTGQMMRHNFEKIKFIQNKKNLGFAKANNQGINKARGEYVLLLNPDTEFIEDALSKTITLMRKDKKIGILGCKLLNSDKTIQPSVRRFPRIRDMAVILFKLHKLRAGLLDYYLARDFDYSQESEVNQVMGAFFLVRSDVFREAGYLDENYFIWFEEVDFCLRVCHSGWKVVYTPSAKIVHHGGQSFSQADTLSGTLRKQFWFFHSACKFFSKRKDGYG